MEKPVENTQPLVEASKSVAQRFFIIMENRLQLFMLEAQEERDRVLQAIWMALGMATFGLLAGVAITALVAVVFWERSPLTALLILTIVYSLAAIFFYVRLLRLQRDWQALPETLAQLRKDRECLEKNIV